MRLHGVFLLAAVLGSIGVASASEVSVRLVGEDGPLGAPAYVVTVDDTLVGTGVLPAPAGALPRVRSDLAAVATDVSFTIPEGVLQPNSVVKVHLINDSVDGNTGADATLYILGVSIDGAAADVTSATIATPQGEAMTIYMAADDALVLAWNAAATFRAPEGGWPHVASAAAEPTPEAPTTDLPTTDLPTADLPTAEAPTDEAAPVAEAEAVAEVPAAPKEVEPACAASATIALTDFANGEASVTEKTAQELIGFFKDVSVDQCKLGVAGYSSPGGEPETNLLVSQERADAVLDFIRGRNLHFASEEAVGRGETTEFGDGGANRRVVVTVGP